VAPAHSFAGCAGVVFGILIVVACGKPGGDEPAAAAILVLGADTFPLARGARVYDIAIRHDLAMGEFAPREMTARPGDVLRFTSLDAGSHALGFGGERLEEDARAFLEESGQLRSLPLLHAGAVWIVSLEGAPAGDYPFVCVTHGDSGIVVVGGG